MTSPTATAGPRAKLPTSVLAIGLTSLLTDASSEMILPLLPALLIGSMGSTPVVLGLVDGFADAISAVLKLAAGRWSDRTQRRKAPVLLGYSLSTAVRPLIGLAMAPWQIVLVRAVDRVGKGIRSAPRDALLAESVPLQDANRAFAFHRAMDHAGAVVGPLLASGLLAFGLAPRHVILAAWAPGILAVLVALSLREPPRVVDDRQRDARRPLVLVPREIRPLLWRVGLFSIAVIADTFLLLRLRELGAPDATLPLAWAVLHVAKVLAASAVGRRATVGKGTLAGAWAVVGGALLLLASSSSVAVGWLAVVLVGAGHGAREPVEKTLIRRAAPKDAHGGAFGAYHLTVGLCALPAGLTLGALWETRGGAAALACSGVVVLAAAVASLGLKDR